MDGQHSTRVEIYLYQLAYVGPHPRSVRGEPHRGDNCAAASYVDGGDAFEARTNGRSKLFMRSCDVRNTSSNAAPAISTGEGGEGLGLRSAMVEGEWSALTDEASPAEGRAEVGRPAVMLVCGSLVYYHCAFRGSSLLSLVSDVLIVLLCSLAILGMLLRQMNIS
ncbi:hypothetical protein GW17_00005232 [Ensete ventricosum]|nr:hypothetical protein GW17_00005226 [Ensete ventricosum]RWW30209.1 hypothetical protein GW17_00005232 [Ensete ventricosum]RZR93446.1 hypothetical protein BHM03_00021954 [Ensete ventricosum]